MTGSESWPRVQLHQICKPKQWPTISKSDMTDEGYPVFGANGVIGFYDQYNHEEATVLVGCRGSCGTVQVCTPKSWVTGNAMALDDLDTDRADQRYLVYALKVDGLQSAVTGTSQPQITQTTLKRVEIPLPPLEEQKRIASILDAANELRIKRQQAIDQLDTLTQAIFHDMFGDPKSTSPEHPLASIGELARNEDSIRVPVKASDRKAMAGEYPYYGASGVIDHVDSYLFEGRRLLVSEDGANLVARSSPIAFLAEGRYWVNNHAHVLADNGRANLVYLREVLEGLDLTASVTGSAQPKLNRKNLDLIRVPEPPRSRQDEYEDRVTCVAEIQERSVLSQFEFFDDLFASLQQRAFRGDL